jgi:AraC family transcriptional regulator of adaptative response/methylated-DNA-[protein]-cysteine methyltransferase
MSVQYLDQSMQDYLRVEQAILYIEQHYQNQPSLDDVAHNVGLSPYHFHRLFKRWAGITPKQFMQFLTIGYAKRLLAESHSVMDASFEAGLSGPGRLHDLFVTFEAISPGEYKRVGAGLLIKYGIHPSPFGECLLATTDRGVCGLSFIAAGQRESALARLKQNWPRAHLVEDVAYTRQITRRIFAPQPVSNGKALPLLVKGTNFQVKVWEALLKIPAGAMVNYGQVAASIGRPSASRAVANAIGQNPVGYIIPCHRVITKTGEFGGYQWGPPRKKAILAKEAGYAAI